MRGEKTRLSSTFKKNRQTMFWQKQLLSKCQIFFLGRKRKEILNQKLRIKTNTNI
jgi:hypothetical protein